MFEASNIPEGACGSPLWFVFSCKPWLMKNDGCARLVMVVVTRPLLLFEVDFSNENRWLLSTPGVVTLYDGVTRDSPK